jgi:hypothetical protein
MRILQCTKFHELLINHVGEFAMTREPNMKMCTLVVYPGPLNFSRDMPVWTWKFDTIHCALCHHNSSHMLNEMFVKLSILQDPNMKMCALVAYPGPNGLGYPTNVHIFILGSCNVQSFMNF